MSGCFANGVPVSLDDAIAEAATALRAAALPAIAGLETDVAGVRAAVRLARTLRGAIDHGHSDETIRALNVMRTGGWMTISPFEARRVCDGFLLVGEGTEPPSPEAPSWRVAARDLAVLRALAADRPVRGEHAMLKGLCGTLKRLSFGCAVWRAENLDEAQIEMLMGLVHDLNASGRFTSIPLFDPASDQALGWLTGLPSRTSFARGEAEHDPWRFDATRLVDAGEASAVLWVSAREPSWSRKHVDVVALMPGGGTLAREPRVRIAAGVAGRDHAGALHCAATGSFAWREAASPSAAPSVADVLDRIGAAL